MKRDLTLLSAADAAESIRQGHLSSEALVEAYLQRIDHTEPTIKAWAWLDKTEALEQAREADKTRKKGHATGALHGVPVGLKDIVDTRTGPTQRGADVFAGREAKRDARVVERLRDAGAVIMGKTTTTELAYMQPTQTTNPHNATRTPGGSSSGSAAAVAARHVPLAIGSQTGGSVIRPASFCGVFGLKPTRGVVSRTGVFETSTTLDHLGCFANTLEDASLLVDAIAGYDQDDPASFARPRPSLYQGACAEPPVDPDIAWFDLPYHDRLNADAHDGLAAVIEILGPRVERFPAAPQLAGLTEVHKTIYDYEIAQNIRALKDEHGSVFGPEIEEALSRGSAISLDQYEDAMGVRASADAFFNEHFNDFDAILSPSATGEALPLSDNSTGDASFCLIWTLVGLPCVTIPALVGETGMPIGVQLIGAKEEDDRLMRTASWMQKRLADASADAED